MCLFPKIIKNKKYLSNKKNGGKIPPLPLIEIDGILKPDLRVLYVPVGCGNCMECRKKKSREWQVRLSEELRNPKSKGIFVTLTFSDESITELEDGIRTDGYERDNDIATKGVRRFLERWRKKYGKSVRHWLVTELGQKGTENIHLHGIIWTDENPKEITRIWKYGYTWLSTDNKGYVNERTVNYVVKYVNKTDLKHPNYKSKILSTPGIGSGYVKRTDAKLNIFKGENTNETYKTKTGTKLALPIYYRNAIYSDNEKEKLWIQKLNKNERWVDGVKIDISKSDEKYYEALKWARMKNKRLNYGTSEIDWNKRRYERERRNLNFKRRIERARGRKGGE